MGILGRVEDGEKGDKPLREGDGEGVVSFSFCCCFFLELGG